MFFFLQILTASNNLSPNTPVIECKGKLMLATQHRQQLKQSRVTQPSPYVSYYHLNDKLEICLDGNTYGNDSRFVHYRKHLVGNYEKKSQKLNYRCQLELSLVGT